MQELRAQIQVSRICSTLNAREDVSLHFITNPLSQAQLRLADAIRKLSEHAERNGIELDMDVQVLSLLSLLSLCIGKSESVVLKGVVKLNFGTTKLEPDCHISEPGVNRRKLC